MTIAVVYATSSPPFVSIKGHQPSAVSWRHAFVGEKDVPVAPSQGAVLEVGRLDAVDKRALHVEHPDNLVQRRAAHELRHVLWGTPGLCVRGHTEAVE